MEIKKTDECFVAIPGWPKYEVSDHGRVRSCCKYGPKNHVEDGWNLLSQYPFSSDKNYAGVTLYRNSKGRSHNVAWLVLEAFVGPRPSGQEVRHLDRDPKNNHLTNLCWGTPLENSDDKRRHGTIRIGSKHGMAKLTEDKVIEIRRRRSAGEGPGKLAKEFMVSQAAISMACLGQRWIHLPL